MNQPEAMSRAGMWAALVLLLAVIAGVWVFTRSPATPAASTDPKDATAAAEHAAVPSTASPPANLPPAPDAGQANAEAVQRAEALPPLPPAPPPVDDAPNQGDGNGAEVAPFAIAHVESRGEREMTFAEKAIQTRTMVARLTERTERVEAQLAEARRSGDAEQTHLQEVMLTRLRQRAQQLTQDATRLEAQATADPGGSTQGESGEAPSPEDEPPPPANTP